MIPLSAVLITKDEEKHIARCLESVSWCDEILVVDGGSTDQTLSICQAKQRPWSSKIRLLERKWTGFKDQRNHALENAKHDWILVIDSDEACSPGLKQQIQKLLSQPGGPPTKAYKVRRQEYFLNKEIQYGIWNPSYQDRFFHRAGVKYINEVHEYPVFPNPPDRIHEPLLHDPEFGPEKFLYKMNKYTSIEARDRVLAGRRTNAFRMISAFPAMFLKNYFYYKSYRDGFHGFAISILEGISRAVRHIKIWHYSRDLDK